MHDGTSRRVHVALTGACGGIGRALSSELRRAGYALTLLGRRRAALERLAGELGTVVHVEEVDLLDRDHVADWIPAAEAALGPIDVLINGAGAVAAGPFPEILPAAAWAVAQVDSARAARLDGSSSAGHARASFRRPGEHRVHGRAGAEPRNGPLLRRQGRAGRGLRELAR